MLLGEGWIEAGSGERGIGDTPRPPDRVNKGSQLFIGRKVTAHKGKMGWVLSIGLVMALTDVL